VQNVITLSAAAVHELSCSQSSDNAGNNTAIASAGSIERSHATRTVQFCLRQMWAPSVVKLGGGDAGGSSLPHL